MSEHQHDPMIFRDGDHFRLTCGDWKHDPASNYPDDNVRWAEWRAALDTHLYASGENA